MRVNSKTMMLNKIISILQVVFGGVNVFFWGIGGTGSVISGDNRLDFTSVIIIITFAVIGVCLLYCGIKRMKLGSALQNYENVIGDRAFMFFEDIADVCNKSQYQVEREFQWLIKKEFFVDAYINHEEKSIVFKEAYGQYVRQQKREERERKKIVYIPVICKCCSGTTKLEKGKIGTCDYCGAPIGE